MAVGWYFPGKTGKVVVVVVDIVVEVDWDTLDIGSLNMVA